MEYQIQGSVLVDGEWVSRPADVYQVMARNQQDDKVEEDFVQPPPNEIPDLGILSKTVIESPFYRTIIPANIRHRDLEDLVFIGEDSVHLKEICDYGHLRHVATKSDFKGRILAARLFGDTRKVHVKAEQSPLPDRASVHGERRSAAGKEAIGAPLEVIVLTLSTRTLMFLWAKYHPSGSTAFVQKTQRLPAESSQFHRPGPHLAVDPKCRAIAVAAHEGRFMLYKTKTMDVWRQDIRAGRDEIPIMEEAQIFIEGRIMHMEFLVPTRTGDDSHVILIFILVHEGKTKVASYDWDFRYGLDGAAPRINRSVLDFEIRKPSLLIPLARSTDFLLVADLQIAVCKGILAGPPTIETTPIPADWLKLLRPGDTKSAPHWVQWDRAPRNSDFDKEAFYIVREDGAVIYVECVNSSSQLEISGGSSFPYPIDTAFACLKAKSSGYVQSYPDMLVAGGAGSDGHLCKVGAWPTEYSYAPPYPETIALGFVESIPNWAPLSDLSVSQLRMPLPHDRSRAHLFITNGKTPHGEISQLRRGLKATIHHSFPGVKGATGIWVVDYGCSTPDQDDTMDVQHYATFIVTAPPESLVIQASRTQEPPSTASAGGSVWDSGWEMTEPVQDHLKRDAETIAACPLTQQFAIQITCNEAVTLRRPTLSEIDTLRFPTSLLAAATRPWFQFIVVAFRENNDVVLQLVPLLNEGFFGQPNIETGRHLLPSDPTCIEILATADGALVVVGVRDSYLYLFRVIESQTLRLVYSTSQDENALNAPWKAYESAVLLSERGQEMLVCATRDGCLIKLRFNTTSSMYTVQEVSVVKMGTTTASVTSCSTDAATAFVACGPDFCRIRLSPRDASLDIDSIWLEDPRFPTFAQGPINTLYQLPSTIGSLSNRRDLSGFMFAVSDDQMIFAQLDYDVKWPDQGTTSLTQEKGKVIPRKVSTMSTPTKLLRLEDMPHHMVIVTNEITEERGPPKGYRTMQPKISLVNLYEDGFTGDSEATQDGTQSAPSTPRGKANQRELLLKPYERVYCMVCRSSWTENGRKHVQIVVGTGIMTPTGKESGRRLVINMTKSGFGKLSEKVYPDPVRCLAVLRKEPGWVADHYHHQDCIISVIGKTLRFEVPRMQVQPDSDNRKYTWLPIAETTLPSPGVCLTVVDSQNIFVSTSHDSYLHYMLMDVGDIPPSQVVQVFTSDSRERPSAHHLVYQWSNLSPPSQTHDDMELRPSDLSSGGVLPSLTHNLMMLTDKNASVTGLFYPEYPYPEDFYDFQTKGAAITLFEACLPRSVIRIHRGDIRPPWRRPYRANDASFQSITGVFGDDILGACSDGTIYSFSLLKQAARRLLRLMQNLIEAKQKRDPARQFSIIRHRSNDLFRLLQNETEGAQNGAIRARDVDPEIREQGEAAPRFKHVDGDVLMRFFEEDGDLKKLAEEGCDVEVGRMFLEKVEAVAREDAEGGLERWASGYEWATKWAGEVLMPLL